MNATLAPHQPVAGVAPPELGETTVMTIWPSIAATKIGRLIGRLCSLQVGFGVFTLGNLFALLVIPIALAVFFAMLNPFSARRYRLTNRRVLIERGARGQSERWVEFDRFDSIDVQVLPGQEWYPAGDLVFRLGAVETLRLAGVSRPETFRHTCLEARMGYVGVSQAGSSG